MYYIYIYILTVLYIKYVCHVCISIYFGSFELRGLSGCFHVEPWTVQAWRIASETSLRTKRKALKTAIRAITGWQLTKCNTKQKNQQILLSQIICNSCPGLPGLLALLPKLPAARQAHWAESNAAFFCWRVGEQVVEAVKHCKIQKQKLILRIIQMTDLHPNLHISVTSSPAGGEARSQSIGAL